MRKNWLIVLKCVLLLLDYTGFYQSSIEISTFRRVRKNYDKNNT